MAQADVIPNPVLNPDGSISVTITITPTVDLPANTVLQVVVADELVQKANLPAGLQANIKTGEDTFEFVVKKMLPTAVGTTLGTVVTAGTTATFGPFTWTPDDSQLYSTNLAVVSFLQDVTASTKTVYQAGFKTIARPGNVTAVEPLKLENINLFPNPADHELTIQLPVAAPERLQLQMVDQVGRVVNEHFIAAGERSKTISTRDLAGGIYLLQIGSGNTSTRKKVLVVHTN